VKIGGCFSPYFLSVVQRLHAAMPVSISLARQISQLLTQSPWAMVAEFAQTPQPPSTVRTGKEFVFIVLRLQWV
jgi:hypothetical protein